MAIDTRAKRASCVGVGRPWLRDKDPDATKGQPWRLASGLCYAGNALATIVFLWFWAREQNILLLGDTRDKVANP